MIVETFLGALPGRRIAGYRNSEPRYVKVLGVGDSARAIIEAFNHSHRANVLTTGPLDPLQLRPMDEPVGGIRPNAVVVVYARGEPVKFPFLTDRTASMLSLIVLDENDGEADTEVNRKVREIKAIADLYVTTSDREFVAELVDNLAS